MLALWLDRRCKTLARAAALDHFEALTDALSNLGQTCMDPERHEDTTHVDLALTAASLHLFFTPTQPPALLEQQSAY